MGGECRELPRPRPENKMAKELQKDGADILKANAKEFVTRCGPPNLELRTSTNDWSVLRLYRV